MAIDTDSCCVFVFLFQGFAVGLDELKLKVPVNEPGFKCVPHSKFMDDCNTCTCDDSGVLARCTAMACDPSERTKRNVNEKCVPGTTWEDDCNQCRCEANGVGSCTRMMCTDAKNSDSENQQSRQTPSATGCVPGTTFMIDCNRCRCGENGIAACTLKGCLTKTRSARQIKQTPESTEQIYTQAEHDSPTFTCTPSQSFKIQCNTCWCAADGKRARFCTRLPCTKSK